MKIKRISEFGLSLVLSLSSLLVVAVPTAHAATVTWDGEGADNNFSTAANWSGDVVPGASDDVVFDNDVEPGDQTYTNDLVGPTFQSLNLIGNGIGSYTITGSAFTLTGGITNSSQGFLTISANIELDGDQAMNISSDVVLSGVISGAGNVTKTGEGELSLQGENTFTGAMTISAGTLTATKLTSLGSPSAGTTVSDGAQLFFGITNMGTDPTIAEPLTLGGDGDGLSWTGYALGAQKCFSSGCTEDVALTLSGDIVLTADTVVTIGYQLKLTGGLSGAYKISVIERSTGKLIIESSSNTSQISNGTYETPKVINTYVANSPATPVSVYYNQTAVVTGTYGAANVSSGGILKGTGTVGSLHVIAGGTLAPGLSPGCINSGNMTLAGIFEVEIGGATACTEYDQTVVTGTVDVTGGTLTTSLFNDFKPASGQAYTIINNDGADAVTGTFADLAEGATFTVDGNVLKISYVGGDGNDVVLSVQSVPTTPETGFQLLANNPIATMAATLVAAGAILTIARRYSRTSTKR